MLSEVNLHPISEVTAVVILTDNGSFLGKKFSFVSNLVTYAAVTYGMIINYYIHSSLNLKEKLSYLL